LKIGLITKNKLEWCSSQLLKAMKKQNVSPLCLNFSDVIARVNYSPEVSSDEINVPKDLEAMIVRLVGRGSLEEIIFRMDVLHRLEHMGMLVINPPSAIERSVDKYHTLFLLDEHGLPVPRTAVTEKPREALRVFKELGEDVVVKPLFGSRGVGSTRVSDPDVAVRVFKAISYYRGVIYLQEFIPHGGSDIRVFTLGDRVLSSMRRVADNWKTNVSLGAKPVSFEMNDHIEYLATRAAETIGCRMAGVDILEGPRGPLIIELNSQPGWRGLQTVTETNIAEEVISYVVECLKK
jgi:ribosomal protein S6--L-glutamate ligase/tetrahydromethanopterin:alpha-L-glutamate ligase